MPKIKVINTETDETYEFKAGYGANLRQAALYNDGLFPKDLPHKLTGPHPTSVLLMTLPIIYLDARYSPQIVFSSSCSIIALRKYRLKGSRMTIWLD